MDPAPNQADTWAAKRALSWRCEPTLIFRLLTIPSSSIGEVASGICGTVPQMPEATSPMLLLGIVNNRNIRVGSHLQLRARLAAHVSAWFGAGSMPYVEPGPCRIQLPPLVQNRIWHHV